ncbi:MAG: polyprenol monophosphomannose synthase [Bacteroidetes bacterium]|nr:polyprenol monophosphomannose synthase [Bacteroidota bacterium]
MEKVLVIVPTYNEAENIVPLITEILKQGEMYHVLVVDDASPDGTAEVVATLQKHEPRVALIRRSGKMGLGTAYVDGFKYALNSGYEYIVEMDADFSHDPKSLPLLLAKAKDFDLVIGSRYKSGVNVVNWPMSRLLLSYFANVYTRFITGMPIHDATSGFVCYRRTVLESLNLDGIHSNGYSFQIEMKFLTWKKGFRVCEVPIIFVDRRVGVSKMSRHIVYEAAYIVWRLKLKSIFGRI